MSNHPQNKWIKYFDSDTVNRLVHIGFKPIGLVEGSLVGDHRSPFHGFAIEFAGHRGYVPGDDVKHIDWKAYYKTGKYLVKQYAQETNLITHILLDVSESMKFEYKHGAKIDYAAFIATAISQVIIEQSDSVGAFFFDNEIISAIRITNTEEVVSKISSAVSESQLKDKSAIGKVLNHAAERMGRRRVVFIISDFFGDTEQTFEGIKRLMDDKHEIVLLHIIDPLEINFDIQGRIELIELEGADRLEVMGVNVKEEYEKLFHEYLAEIKQKCLALGIDYLLCDMSKSFGYHLAEYLSSRSFRKA